MTRLLLGTMLVGSTILSLVLSAPCAHYRIHGQLFNCDRSFVHCSYCLRAWRLPDSCTGAVADIAGSILLTPRAQTLVTDREADSGASEQETTHDKQSWNEWQRS